MADGNHGHLPHVLVLHPPEYFSLYQSQYSHKFHFLNAWESPLPLDQFLSTHARNVQALLSCGYFAINADILCLLPSLRLVVTPTTGLNHIDLSECRRRGVAVANTGGVASVDVADMAVGLFIDVLRKISAANRYVRQWQRSYPFGSKLKGKRIGIVGLGRIGQEVAKRLEAFGCSISYNSRKQKPSFSYPFYSNVVKLAANSDVLVICCGLNDETHHLINKEVLLALGKEGVVINVGRGAIIDEKEMVQCLVHGDIGGAGLDVFENEPNVPKELFALDNVVLSPHRAPYTSESIMNTRELAVGNLEAFFSDKPLLSQVVDD
uniref:glyoxylate reductase (NADP(+)) n=1 Tax=Fagus sylvatica TaxID=28930 RepID=A0A2N9G2H7_FAGSY